MNPLSAPGIVTFVILFLLSSVSHEGYLLVPGTVFIFIFFVTWPSQDIFVKVISVGSSLLFSCLYVAANKRFPVKGCRLIAESLLGSQFLIEFIRIPTDSYRLTCRSRINLSGTPSLSSLIFQRIHFLVSRSRFNMCWNRNLDLAMNPLTKNVTLDEDSLLD